MSDKKCLFPYVGGKNLLIDWIIPFIPKDHICYVEVFGGACSVLLNKKPSKSEVYNDIDDNLVNFLMTLRDEPEKFFEKCYQTPFARTVYEKWKKEWKDEVQRTQLNPFERACRYYILTQMAYSGYLGGGWSYSSKSNSAMEYYNACGKIFILADRFKNVQIENLDFRDLIKRYDSPDTVIYADPPYVGVDWYCHSFKEQDHQDLAGLLNKIQGKAIVSYYAGEIEKLYAGWYIERKIVSKFSQMVKSENGQTRDKETEILIMNFKPEPDNLILF